jgi:hypothetical protein
VLLIGIAAIVNGMPGQPSEAFDKAGSVPSYIPFGSLLRQGTVKKVVGVPSGLLQVKRPAEPGTPATAVLGRTVQLTYCKLLAAIRASGEDRRLLKVAWPLPLRIDKAKAFGYS